MPLILSRLISAWPLVARRSIAHWKLLSSVVVGVLLASAIMSGTVIYFDALRELALKSALARLAPWDVDVVIKAERGPTTNEEYEKVLRAVNGQLETRVDWLLRDRIRGGKSATFFLTLPGNEVNAGNDNARSFFAFSPRLEEKITLVRGNWGQEKALSAPGEPLVLEAVIPMGAANLFQVDVGDFLSAVPYWDDAIPYAHVIISGIFEKNDPNDPFWHLDQSVFQAATSGSFRSVPFYISEKAFMEVLGAEFRDLDTTYGWLLDVEPSTLDANNANLARLSLDLMDRRLSADLFSYRQITSLDSALAEYDQRLFFSKLPMFIVLILIAVVILYYVVTLSSLLVEQQRSEIALLRSRGASSAQILTVFVLEGATISILAIVVAPLLAAIVISFMGFTPAFSDLSGSDRLAVNISRGAYMMAALGGVLSFVALIIPAVQASRIGVTVHRQQAARPTSQPVFQRYYMDVLLLVVSVILFQRLTEQGSVVAVSVFGQIAVNQLLLAVPALILVAFAMVMLRLFPLAIRFISGDSPALLHIVVAGTVLVLVPSILTRGIFDSTGLMWLAQAALLSALGGVYWATNRTRQLYFQAGGMIVQAGLVAGVLLMGPDLPAHHILSPILIGIVPAQVAFILLKAFGQVAPVGYSIGLWQMARNPTHYARLSLLMILMAGLGIFAASFGGTLERSFLERAMYSTGADVRLEGVVLNSRGPSRPVEASYQKMPGVEGVSPVYRGFGIDLSRLLGESYTMIALNNEDFDRIGWFRDDFSDKPMDELLASLSLPSLALPIGITLPDDARAIGVRIKSDRPHSSIAATARIKDVNNRYFTFFMGTLGSTDWLELEANLTRSSAFSRRQPLQPVPPLTLVSLAFHEMNTQGRLRAGSAIIDEVRVRTSNGLEVIEPFDGTDGWSKLKATPDAISDSFQKSDIAFNGGSGSAMFAWAEGNALISRGIYHGPPISPIPVLASKSFLDGAGHRIGDEFEVSVAGHRILVRIVDRIDFFPTLDTINDKFLISDINSLISIANLEVRASEIKPNEIWLSTDGDAAEREQLIAMLAESEPFSNRVLHDREVVLAASQVDPLVQAGWRALLFIAFAAILILSSLGFLVHAYVSFRSREGQFALMRTIGFSMRQLVVLVWLEQALVIVAGLALGSWMGGRLGSIIMPFLAHDDRGSQVLPPFILEINLGTLMITYAAMAVVFALIISGMILFIRRISLHRTLRMGEM